MIRDTDDPPLDPAPMSTMTPMPPMPPLPQLQANNPLVGHTNEDMARLSLTANDLNQDQLEEEADTGKMSPLSQVDASDM